MTTFRKLLCGLLLALLFAACSEREESGLTRVQGQVVLAESNTPVPRPPQVQVWGRSSGGSGLGGRAYVPVGAPYATNERGQFDFSFPAEIGQQYILRAEEGGLGYYTDWNLVPSLRNGQNNDGIRLPVYAPAWIRLDLVDEMPRSVSRVDVWGWGGGGLTVYSPKDTSFIVQYLAGRPEALQWEINANGQRVRNSKSFTLFPLDTQRVRIAF